MSPQTHGTLAERLFSSPLDRRFLHFYRRVFSINEIEKEPILQIALGALLLSVFLGLSRWFYSHTFSVSAYTDNVYTCWPYFQDCGRWYFLQALPEGYSQSIFFMGVYALMVLAAYFMYRKEWTLVHMALSVVWVCKFIILFILTSQLAANFDYYDTLLLFVVLFLPSKLFFARLAFVLFYFLSSTIKIHEGWILGTYFTTLSTGLPLFGNALAPLVTNLVIFMQIVGVWFLFSSKKLFQRTALIYFILFHLYSGILVGFRYPTIALVMLLVLFALPPVQSVLVPRATKRALAGWLFVALLFVIQFIPIIVIRGDQKMTLEGNYYGFFMFEANHQCISRSTVHFSNGTTRESIRESSDSTWRCDPYELWFVNHNRCERNPEITHIEWTFDHSINGGPFYRMVDVEDACALEYKAFSHNEWIRVPGESAAVVGYPVKNYFQ